MAESFGARLREQRERQQIDLSLIAAQTKIKVSLLEALERGDVSRWPTGIFRRAFMRSYAEAIGLEADTVVREFLELYPDPLDVEANAVVAFNREGSSSTPPMRLRYLVGSAIGTLSSRLRAAHKSVLAADEPAASAVVDGADGTATDGTDLGPAIPVPAEALSTPVPAAAPPIPVPAQTPVPAAEPDLVAVASLCSELAKVNQPEEVAPLIREAAAILGAIGVMVWVRNPAGNELIPTLASGYSESVLARLPRVPPDGSNALAAAFRTAQTRIVIGGDDENGAVVIPLLTSVGCVGVLAIELQHGRERSESLRASATILAAQLATLVATDQSAEASSRKLA